MTVSTVYEDASGGGKTIEQSIDTDATNGTPIWTPAGDVGVSVIPGSGTAKAQYTRSLTSKVKAATAVWVDVSAASGTAVHSIVQGATAVRLAVVTGAAVMAVRLH